MGGFERPFFRQARMDRPQETAPQTLFPELEPRISRRASALGFGLVVLFAGLLRFADLGHAPNGLFRDEAEKGYNAFALAASGGVIEFPVNDPGAPPIRWRSWPLVIDVVGVKTSAIYQYVSVPFITAFGLTPASARMTAALIGTLAVAALGLLLLRVWSPLPALAAMLWLALCPWHYVFSRWALQGIFVPFWIVVALAGLAAAERERRWGFPLTGAALGLIFYSYSGAQPFVLAWGAVLLLLYSRAVRAQAAFAGIGFGLFVLFSLPRIVSVFVGGGGARLDAIAVWTADDATPLNTIGRVALNYLAHFDPRFLFFRGDELERHSVPGVGQLLIIDALLMPVGIYYSFKNRVPLRGALVACFLCGPVGAAITRIGIPHALRSFPMVVPAVVWSGLGLAALSANLYARLTAEKTGDAKLNTRALIATKLMMIAPFIYALGVYRVYWRAAHADSEVLKAFAHTERLAFETAFENRAPGERVFVSSEIAYAPYFALFFGQLPPRETAAGGLENQGIIIYDASRYDRTALAPRMNTGDQIIELDADAIATIWEK